MIRDILNTKERVISLEIFPPKQDGKYDTVSAAIKKLTALKPGFMSVTYGAGGSTTKNTLNICKEVQLYGITALAHLTCVSCLRDDIEQLAEQFKQNGIKNILALRGDIPKDSEHTFKDYDYAYELVSHLKQLGDFCIGGACYPEGHIGCESIEKDIEHTKIKVDTGCEFLISQFFFDNDYFYSYLDKLTKANVTVPVIVGLMPVQRAGQIVKMCSLSGAAIPNKLQKLLGKYSDNDSEMAKAGVEYVVEQILDLLANNINKIHIYTMNKPAVAEGIITRI